MATTDFTRVAEADAIIVCVPTPLGNHREPDLKYVRMLHKVETRTARVGVIRSGAGSARETPAQNVRQFQ